MMMMMIHELLSFYTIVYAKVNEAQFYFTFVNNRF